MGGRLVDQLNAFAVEVHVLFGLEERIGRPRAERRRRPGARRRAHRLEHVFVSDDEGALRARFAELAREISGDQLGAGAGNLQVAAGVIGVRMRVHDEANRPVAGHLLDRREEPVGVFLAHRVDDENALRPDLEQGVAGSAGEEVDLPVHRQNLDRRRPLLRTRDGAMKDDRRATPIAVILMADTNPRGTTACTSYFFRIRISSSSLNPSSRAPAGNSFAWNRYARMSRYSWSLSVAGSSAGMVVLM